MLVLSRKRGQEIVINGNITLTVVEITDKVVRLGIQAPKDIPIMRSELLENPPDSNTQK